MPNDDVALRQLSIAIVTNYLETCSQTIKNHPGLATACFSSGATRQDPSKNLVPGLGRYIFAGDTALHVAAAAYQSEIARVLIDAGADVRAKNRHGYEPLHAAAAGQPGSRRWNPPAQSKMVELLIAAGADPNATDKRGVTPLHIAVRTRCAAAVETLLGRGADRMFSNKNGSTPLKLARMNTGRGGSGSEEAKAQQLQILRLFEKS